MSIGNDSIRDESARHPAPELPRYILYQTSLFSKSTELSPSLEGSLALAGDLGFESLLTTGRVLAPGGALALVGGLAHADALPPVRGLFPELTPFRFRVRPALKFL